MCQGCVDAVDRVFPGTPENEYGDILMSMTAFPFERDPAKIERQLRTARKALTQGRGVCMMCGKAKARKHMDGDFCKKLCLQKWNEVSRRPRSKTKEK